MRKSSQLIAFLLVLTVTGCSTQAPLRTAVRRWVRQAEPGDRVLVSDLTRFDWDKAYYFADYPRPASPSEMVAIVGLDLREVLSETGETFLFIKDGQVIYAEQWLPAFTDGADEILFLHEPVDGGVNFAELNPYTSEFVVPRATQETELSEPPFHVLVEQGS